MRFSIKDIVTKNWYVIPLFLIAGFLRLFRLSEYITFLGDQGRDAIIVKRIVMLEHFPAIGAPSSVGQIYLGPFYYYFISPFLLLFNFHPVGLAFAVAFYSLFGIIASYFIVKKEINTITAFIFTCFSTFSILLIYLSRFSWNPNLLPIFGFLTLYFFKLTITSKNRIYPLLFGAFLSFTIQLHYLALLLFIPVGIFLIYLHKTLFKKDQLKKFLYAIGSFAFFYSPLLIFDLKHEFLNSKSFLKLFTENQVVSGSSIFDRFIDTNQAFFESLLQRAINDYIALALFILVTLYTLLLFIKYTSKDQLFIKINAVAIVTYLIGFSFLSSPRHLHYYGTIYLCFFLFVSFLITSSVKSKIIYLVAPIVLLSFIYSNITSYYFFKDEPNTQVLHAQKVADSFKGKITDEPIQLVPLPQTDTDGHFRYFLELAGYKILSHDSPEQPKELYVLCFDPKDCQVLGNGQWQIASFSVTPPIVATQWESEGVTIYKLIHKSK